MSRRACDNLCMAKCQLDARERVNVNTCITRCNFYVCRVAMGRKRGIQSSEEKVRASTRVGTSSKRCSPSPSRTQHDTWSHFLYTWMHTSTWTHPHTNTHQHTHTHTDKLDNCISLEFTRVSFSFLCLNTDQVG